MNSLKLNLYNALGTKVLDQILNSGTQTYSIPLNQLHAGVYVLAVSLAEKNAVKKLIIQ